MSNRLDARKEAVDLFLSELMDSGDDWEAGGSLPDLLEELYKGEHIDVRHLAVAGALVCDMRQIHGSSGGLTARYGSQVDGGRSEGRPPRFGARPEAFDRMNRVLRGLRQHERELLKRCILNRELRRGGLAQWGREQSAYAHGDTARAFAVGQVKSMLETLGELYRSHVPQSA